MGGVRVGQGFDAHRWVAGESLVLGGCEIPHASGLAGHSDGDALLHAIADAVLGALGQGDLGAHFPSSDASLRGVASGVLLGHVVTRMAEAGYRVGNVDATVIAQAPRLSPFQDEMCSRVAELLQVSETQVNVKITSTDRLGALGREEGIAALAVVLLEGAGDAP